MINITSDIERKARRLRKSKINPQRIKKLFISRPSLKMMLIFLKMIRVRGLKITEMFKTTPSAPSAKSQTEFPKNKANHYRIKITSQQLQSNRKNQQIDTNCQKTISNYNTPTPTLRSSHPSTRHLLAKAK